MKITSINLLPDTCKALGLGFYKGIELKNLGQTVCLFGENGVGKTRFLKIIYKLLTDFETTNYLLAKCILEKEIVFDFNEDGIKNVVKDFNDNPDSLTYVYCQYNKEKKDSILTENYNSIENKGNIRQKINTLSQYIKQHTTLIEHKLLLELKDKINTSFNLKPEIDLQNKEDIQETLLTKFFDITNDINIFGRFAHLFEKIMGKKIELVNSNETVDKSRSRNNNCTFCNIKIANDLCQYKDLSDGEKILFAFTLVLFCYTEKNTIPLQNSILIFDEPEKSLHPSAINKLLEKLKMNFKPSQILLASHSIDVLASLDFKERFHLQKDEKFNQKDVYEMIKTLTGEDLYAKENKLFTSLFYFAYQNFVIECLTHPEMVNFVNKEDKQVQAFINRMKQKKENKLRILEVGAGTGRIYKSAKDNLKNHRFETFEPNPNCRQQLEDEDIDTSYKRITDIPQNAYDIILLCNVLHEIPPIEWRCSLNHLIKALKDDGEFIFIEQEVLSKGEHTHEYDFFVFEYEEFKILFNIKEDFKEICINNSEIICVPIQKNLIKSVTDTSINNAVRKLQSNSWNKIEEIKSKFNNNEEIKLGKKLAFYSVQYINCERFLKNTSRYK